MLNASRYFFLSLLNLDQKSNKNEQKRPKVPISGIYIFT